MLFCILLLNTALIVVGVILHNSQIDNNNYKFNAEWEKFLRFCIIFHSSGKM